MTDQGDKSSPGALEGGTPANAAPVEEIVRTIDLVKEYRMGDEVLQVLKGVNLAINKGEYISIMGPSGSGKSTLFNMIGGLDKPTSGKVFIDEVDIAQLDALELAWLRCRKIGYIFQTFNLIPVMTALENVMLPMIFGGMSNADAQEKAAEILKKVELEHRLFNKPSQLSGGQQQRVAIARAFANDPAIILADEPTGNLDLNTGKAIIELLRQLNQEQGPGGPAGGTTIISATHDFKMLDVSDRIIWIRDGAVDRIEKRENVKIDMGEIHSTRRGGSRGMRDRIAEDYRMPQEARNKLETDDRFPTGEWRGFWVQRAAMPGRQRMDLTLSFEQGKIRGDGNDTLGAFTMQGRYDLQTGKVTIHKYYVGQHHVLYEGWAEINKGIWGIWKIPPAKDGFHIWPRNMPDPSKNELAAEAAEPGKVEKPRLVDV